MDEPTDVEPHRMVIATLPDHLAADLTPHPIIGAIYRATTRSGRPVDADERATIHVTTDDLGSAIELLGPTAEAVLVDRRLRLDRSTGARAPGGILQTSFVAALPHLDPAEFARMYAEHTALVRTHHIGVAEYAQSIVVDRAGASMNRAMGVSELWFATRDDLRERFYTDETSAEIVGADVDRFIDREPTWSTHAHT